VLWFEKCKSLPPVNGFMIKEKKCKREKETDYAVSIFCIPACNEYFWWMKWKDGGELRWMVNGYLISGGISLMIVWR
jgi:hypothetical protein